MMPMELFPREQQPTVPVSVHSQGLEEFLQGLVALGGPEGEAKGCRVCLLEQIIERMKFNIPGECPATQDPTRDFDLVSIPAPSHYADGPERPELVFIGDPNRQAVLVLQMPQPLSFREAHAIEVELIGLVD